MNTNNQMESNMTVAYININAIKSEYAPYDKMPEFSFGMWAYRATKYEMPKGFTGVQQQAFDRGMEIAMRITKANAWVEQNVGAN